MMEEAPDADAASEAAETAEIPLSFAGAGVKEGDEIRLRVISVGDGSLTVSASAPAAGGGSDGMAREFDNENNQEPS